MATFKDIGIAAGFNILFAVAFLVAFAILRLQPFNDRVYFPKWYLKGLRCSPINSSVFVNKFVNLDWRSYIRFLNWVPDALRMPEPELIDHAGLDSAVYLRIYLLGLKIFVPVTLLAWAILVPVNWTNHTLAKAGIQEKLEYSDIDKLSISNIPEESHRFWAHVIMAYAFALWTCYALSSEYAKIAAMRLHFLASERRRADQFTVLVRNVPPDADESVTESVEHFFLVNHPDNYLTHQVVINANKLAKLVKEKKAKENWLDYYQLKYLRNQSKRPMKKIGCLGLCGNKVDAIDYQTAEINRLSKEVIVLANYRAVFVRGGVVSLEKIATNRNTKAGQIIHVEKVFNTCFNSSSIQNLFAIFEAFKIAEERKRVKTDVSCIMPAAFVSFKSRWGAAVCAQTQQSRNPTLWMTEWAPEPRDVYWNNLAIPYVSLSIRRLIVAVAFFFLTFFFMIPVTIAQSFANIEALEKRVPFLRPIIERGFLKGLIQGLLPGIALKIFLIVLPTILMMMSKFEGFLSISSLERRSATRYYLFNFINVFLVSVITGSAMEQLNSFLNQSANEIPRKIGAAIPMKATFFITYVMVDGWAGVAGEILRLKPLIFYHIKNFFLVKTEKDREDAMDPGSIGFNTGEPQIQLYFLLGLIYAVVTPVFLPFILVFFALAYVVYRHQIINVYNQEYESAAAFWPDVHGRIVFALVFSQIVLIGLMSTKKAALTAPFLIALPVITISFHLYCKGRYQSAFVKFPLQEAMTKDTLERAREPNLNLKGYLQSAYIHPVFKNDEDEEEDIDSNGKLDESVLVPTKRQSRRSTPAPSKLSGASSPEKLDI